MIGLITLNVKQTGKRSAGKPRAAFDVAGAGNVAMVVGMRSKAKAMELPPTPTVRAPGLDPTCERLRVKSPGSTHPSSICQVLSFPFRGINISLTSDGAVFGFSVKRLTSVSSGFAGAFLLACPLPRER